MSKAKDALKNAFKTALYFLPFAHALKAIGWIQSVTSATKLIFAKSLITGLTSKGTPALSQNFGAKLSFRSPTAPRQIIYGKARVGATIVFVETTGTDNYLLHMVMVFSGHEVEELVSVRFNDTNLTSTTSTINGSTVHTVTNSKYVNSDNENKLTSGGALIRYTFEDGSQTAVNGFMAAQTSLTTNHKFKDCSYLYVQMAYDAEAFSGIPNISAVIKGKKCYDPRTGNTVWTDNPALHVRDYLSNTTYGLKATTSELNDANSSGGFWSAANICEQTVNLPDSATEQRYTGNGSTNMTARGDQVLEGLLSSMSGKLTYTNGKFNVFPGTAQTPSLSITDTELLSPMEIITNSTTGDLYNSVKPIFVDASTNYTPTDAPIYENSTFLSEDTPSGESNSNYVKRLEPNLAFTTTNTMAQRLGRIMLNDQRQTVGLSCLVSLKYMQLQPNDWVQITNSRLSYTNKNFQVVTTNLEILEEDGVPIAATRLELREIDSSIYTFGTSDYGTMVSEGASVGTGDLSVSPPSGLAVSAELVVIGYDLEVTWTNNSSDAVQGTEIKYGTSSGTYIGSVTAGKGQSKIIVPNLKANTTYYVSARHFSSNNVFSSFTSEVTINTGSSSDIATPSAPSNLSVTTNKPLQIGVTWTSPSNTDTRAVKVYRKTSNVTPTDDTNLVETVACEPGTTQKVTYGKEDGLTAGTTYYFWVRAISFSEKHSAFAGSQSGTFGDVTGSDISTSTTITAGTGNNVGVLDGADSTYRIYAGHATPGSAPFRVTQAGVLTATNATITGNVTANSLNVTGATVTGTLDASVITLNGNALSGLMGSSGTGSSTVLAVGPDVKNQIKVGSSSVEYIAYDDVTEQGHKALDMQFGSTTYYPTASVTGWQSTIINPGNGSNTGYLSAPSYILQNAGSSVTSTTNRLYNLNGTLYWDGNVVGLGSGTITGVVAGTNLNGGGTSGSVTLNLDSTITGNHTFSNNVVIGGDLTVQGTTTTIDTTNLDVKDKNITLNYGSGDTSGNADGAGITIQDAVDASTNATLLWDQPNSEFVFSHPLQITHGTPILNLYDSSSSGNFELKLDGTTATVDNKSTNGLLNIKTTGTGDLTLDAGGDIVLDAGGQNWWFDDDGTRVFSISQVSSDVYLGVEVADKDLIFRGNDSDGGGAFTALTFDMSEAGTATFNSGATLGGNLTLSYAYPRINLTDTNNDSDYSIINNDGSFGIYDVTNSAYRLTISASGHLEIKKTTDFGNTTTYGGSTQRGLISWNAGTKFKIRAATSHALSLGAGGIEDYLYIQADGNIAIGNTNASAKLDIRQDSGVAIRVEDSSGGYFGVTADKRVGIGTVSPNDTLELSAASPVIRGTDTDGGGAKINFGSGNITLDADYGDGQSSSIINFKVDGSEAARFDSSSRLLINATSTSFDDQLYLVGNAYITGGWRVGTTATYVGKMYNNAGKLSIETDGTRDIRFGSSTNTEAMYIDTSDQRVGIGGTTSPATTLEVVGDLTLPSDGQIKFKGTNHYPRIYASSNDLLINLDNGSGSNYTGLKIDNVTGNVGISTTSPNYLLDVESSTAGLRVYNTSTHCFVRIVSGGSTNNSALYFGDSDDGTRGQITYRNNGDSMAFSTGGVERARLSGAGVLSIGTTSTTPGFSTASGIALHPSDMSHISRNAGTPLALNRGGGHGDVLNLRSGGSSVANIGTSTTGIYIDSNLGINTTSIDEKLQVEEGDIKIEGGENSSTRALKIAHTGWTSNQVILEADSGSSYGRLRSTGRKLLIEASSGGGAGTNETLVLKANTNTGLVVDTNGRIGIGNTGGQAQLDILSSNAGKYLYASDGSNGLFQIKGQTDRIIMEFSTVGWSAWETADFRANYFVFKPNNAEKYGFYHGHAEFKSALRFTETGGGSNYVGFQAPASIGTDVTWTLPNADGVTGSFLKTDGSGNLSWSSNTITSFSTPGTGYLITSDSSSSSGVSGEPTLQYEGAYDGLTLLESGGHNAYLSFGASDDTAVGQIRFYSASTPVTLTGAAGELQLTNGDFSVADSKKLKFGSDGDLEIYHDGSSNSSYIKETGAGSLYIEASNLFLQREAGTENFIDCITNGAVTLYYNNSAKLATTDAGLDVTGDLDITRKIRHIGDTDTYLSFANNDDFRIVTGNSTRAQFNNNVIWFNQEGINQDFRVESSDNEYMFFLDASTNRIGLNTSAYTAANFAVSIQCL